MNVLVIPEDFRNDQYILKPIIESMFAAIGRGRVKVRILMNPVIGGVARALDWPTISQVIDRYQGMVDLFLLIVDRDGDANRRQALDRIEQLARERSSKRFLAENAWQEIEVWALAAQTLPAGWKWAEVRAEPQAKERYFLPLAKEKGILDQPAQGRVTLGLAAASNYTRVRQLCPEDVGALERRISEAL